MISRTDFVRTAEAGNLNDNMLAPSAYADSLLPSLRLARSSRTARVVGKVLLTLLICGFVLVAFAPWQQSVTGSGKVVAFNPNERPQKLEAPIKGRLQTLPEGIFENAHVKKGDVIARILDLDEDYSSRLQDSLENLQMVETLAKQAYDANVRAMKVSQDAIQSFQNQVEAYTTAKEEVLAAADAGIESAKAKIKALEQKLIAAQAANVQAEQDYDRQKVLFEEKDAVAQKKFQKAEQYYLETSAKVRESREYINEARQLLVKYQRERNAKAEEAQAKIDEAKTKLQKGMAEAEKAASEVAKASSMMNKARKDVIDQEVKVARQGNQEITAPFDGFLMDIVANNETQILKEGDLICKIVPDTSDRAVEVWLDGNDAPLVTPGRHVRLQFEGWPAIQFAGWPSAAIGTFGGEIISVDSTDKDGTGKFRVLVKPTDDGIGWPDDRYLRQGVRTNAWVLLDQVSLWYEIWRNMNGFPPVVDYAPDEQKKSKPPKLPK